MSKKYQHITIVVQRSAKSFHDGIKGISGAMGKSPIILANKLNPACENNYLTLEEAAEIIELTRDPAPIDALAALLNRTTVPLPEGEPEIKELLTEYVRLTQESGVLGKKILDAKDPDSDWGEQISPTENKALLTQMRKVQQVLAGLIIGLEN